LHEHAQRLTRAVLSLHSARLENQTEALRALVGTLDQARAEMMKGAGDEHDA
jgi:hypothetical protein